MKSSIVAFASPCSARTLAAAESSFWRVRSRRIASIARDYGRKVGAVPGRITDESSRGSNILLRDAGAHLVTDGSDIADLLDGNTFRLDLHTLMQGSPTRQAAQATGLSR